MIEELNADSTGKFLVMDKHAGHYFDLDHMIYMRKPRKNMKGLPGDNDPQIIDTIALYPMVGLRFLVFTEDAEIPHLMEQLRISDTILSIERYNGPI